jgi:hypothetical protein
LEEQMPIPDKIKPARPGRRKFLKRAAQGTAAVTVVAAGGLVWRGMDRRAFSSEAGPAYAPWDTWKQDMGKGPLGLVRAAILASSPHNTQPWLFRVGADKIELFAHRARNLGSFDPYLREMHIGLGCAVENMRIAAGPNGYAVRVAIEGGRLTPPGSNPAPAPVATLHLSKVAAANDPLFDAIPNRHTNRGDYDKARGVPAAALHTIQRLADAMGNDTRLILLPDAARRDGLAGLINRATLDITRDRAMSRDSEAWFRFSPEAVDKYRDGVTLDSLTLPPVLRVMAKLLPPPDEAQANQYWIDNTRDMHLGTAPVLAVLAVRDLYDRTQALAAGRIWQRLHLWATAKGLAMHPINQAVEMVDRDRQLGRDPAYAKALEKFTGPGWQATFMFRIGYPDRRGMRSPRRPVETVVLAG